jgi:hypothetical protein
LNLRKGWFRASNGYGYIWEPDHPNSNKQGYVAEHAKVMASILGGLCCQKRRCITVTGRGTIIVQKILNCGLEAGNHPEHESVIW